MAVDKIIIKIIHNYNDINKLNVWIFTDKHYII